MGDVTPRLISQARRDADFRAHLLADPAWALGQERREARKAAKVQAVADAAPYTGLDPTTVTRSMLRTAGK